MSMLDLGGGKGTAGQGIKAVVTTALVWQTASGFAIEADDVHLAPPDQHECRTLDEVTRVLAAAGISHANIVLREHVTQ